MRAQPGRLIFLDETSVKTNLTRLRGRCPKGKRLRADAPFGRWQTQTFVAGLKLDGIVAPFVVQGAMDGEAFDTYVRTQLAPAIGPGDVVVLDNLNVHRSPRAAKALAERGAWFLFLPRYSPDLNPIEMAFAKLKAHLRAGAHRTIDELWRAIGSICDLYAPEECRNYFRATGYVHK
jgi:transposase